MLKQLDAATHSEGSHSKGSLIHDNVQNVLIYRNLYDSNKKRNPHFKGGTSGTIINNVITNQGDSIIRYERHPEQWKGKSEPVGHLYVVGNNVFHGVDTRKSAIALRVTGLQGYRVTGKLQAYAVDNHVFNKKINVCLLL